MPPRRSTKRHRLAPITLLLPLFVLAAACGDDGSADDAREPTTETTGAPDTDSTATTVEAEGPAEWVAVARDIAERSFQLRANPDLARLADLYSETCECWERERSTIQFLLDNNERVEGGPADVLFVRYEQTDTETGLVNLTVRGQSNPLRRVNADDEVVQEIPAEEPSCVAYALLDDGPDGAWRIYSQTTLPACPEEAT